MIRVLALAALTVGGCASSQPDATVPADPAPPVASTPPASVADTLRLGLGETAEVAGVAVRFDAVTEDSRCPQNVTCVWEGRARVRLVVGETPAVLTVGSSPADEPSSAKQDGVSVDVMALHPFPGSPEAEGGAPVEVELAVRTD